MLSHHKWCDPQEQPHIHIPKSSRKFTHLWEFFLRYHPIARLNVTSPFSPLVKEPPVIYDEGCKSKFLRDFRISETPILIHRVMDTIPAAKDGLICPFWKLWRVYPHDLSVLSDGIEPGFPIFGLIYLNIRHSPQVHLDVISSILLIQTYLYLKGYVLFYKTHGKPRPSITRQEKDEGNTLMRTRLNLVSPWKSLPSIRCEDGGEVPDGNSEIEFLSCQCIHPFFKVFQLHYSSRVINL